MSENLEKEIKQENLTWASAWRLWPSSSRPAQPAGGPARLLLCRLRPRQREGSCPARARATAPRHQSPCLPGALLVALERPDDATQPPRPLSHTPSPSFSPPALSLSHPKHCRRRSSPPTRSPPSPRPSVESPSSAATPSPSSPSKQPGRAPLHRNRRRLQAPADEIAVVAPAAPSLPRARRRRCWIRGELRHRSPLFSPSFPRRSAVPHHGRSLSPPSMSPSPSRPASAQTEHPFALPVPRGCRRAPQVASPCPAGRSRSRPNSGRRPSGRRRRFRPSLAKRRAPVDAREPQLPARALRCSIGRRSGNPAPSAAFAAAGG